MILFLISTSHHLFGDKRLAHKYWEIRRVIDERFTSIVNRNSTPLKKREAVYHVYLWFSGTLIPYVTASHGQSYIISFRLLDYCVVKNKRRQEFLALYLLSLALSGSVQFHKAAQHLNPCVQLSSNTKRIQDFYREVSLDYDALPRLFYALLPKKGIGFCVRVPKHHTIEQADGTIWTSETILAAFTKGVQWENCRVDGVWGNVEVRPIVGDDGILFIFGTVKVSLLAQLYRKRWRIEVCFQQLKTRGFNLEDSHMYHLDRLKKLVGMIALSYGLCLSIGLYRHYKEKHISKKNHGYKANSFFRHGLNYLTNLFSQRKAGFENELRNMVVKAATFIQDEYETKMLVEISSA